MLEHKMNDDREPDGTVLPDAETGQWPGGESELEQELDTDISEPSDGESDDASGAEPGVDREPGGETGDSTGEDGAEHEIDSVGRDRDLPSVDDDLPPVDDDASPVDPASLEKSWYILKAQVNRETSVCDALRRRVQRFGLGGYFGEMLVPTEDVREFTKAGKSRIVKRKLYPGYIMVNMALTEESWWLVRDTPGIGDFTSMGGKPTALGEAEFDKILRASRPLEIEDGGKKEDIKTSIKHKVGDKVRVKDGNFENFEGEVSAIDERNGRVTVLINIFGRLNPVELDHWQVEGI